MTPTNRDIAEFYRLSLQYSDSNRRLVQLSDVTAWVDGLIASSDIAYEWMIDLSFAQSTEDMLRGLCHVPGMTTNYLGASIFTSYLRKLWLSGAIQRDEMCRLLWNIRDEIRPEHDIPAIVPEVTLEDVEASSVGGVRDPKNFTPVDDALDAFFSLYDEFSQMIPPISGVM
ncbi:hypothetical protein Pan258_00650 [Symmachiella dynata]|uniref:hypothetical protein n=1 Tax=Symmachiella dynata TaxID=2527995 RepID=UPI001189BB25|nr:hypothetical protein [Symmachiella dynata]QDT46048.1 hypothetical protein Pan258_00650 [Symmachiella dynata]